MIAKTACKNRYEVYQNRKTILISSPRTQKEMSLTQTNIICIAIVL